jgi:RNA recognition motif-containing protein
MSCPENEIININDLSCLLTSIQKGLYEDTAYPAYHTESETKDEYNPAYPALYDDTKMSRDFQNHEHELKDALHDSNKKSGYFPADYEAIELLNQLSYEYELRHSKQQNQFRDSTGSRGSARRFSPYPQGKSRFSSEDNISNVSSNTVYVCNINYEASESDLFYYFEKIGQVMNVKIMEKNQNGQRKRWAFVTYASVDMAERCIATLNQKVFMDRKIGISFARLTK